MKNSKNLTQEHKKSANPQHSADECSMEEAHDRGDIPGPRPDLRERDSKPESELRSRTDVPGGCP